MTGGTVSWVHRPAHREWMAAQTRELLGFYRAMLGSDGHFCELDDDGGPFHQHRATPGRQRLLTVSRAVHCYALGEMLGVPGCGPLVTRGLETIWEDHRDPGTGGYVTEIGLRGPIDPTKGAYEHAFVLLAASSALEAGHDQAAALLGDVLSIIDDHFWDEEAGAGREAFDRDWNELEPYRGANSNMHLCEGLMAASEVTGRADLALRADRIARRLVDTQARAAGWLLPEHYDTDWVPIASYNEHRPDDPFRPPGATVGHGLEWSRLTLAVGLAVGGTDGWYLEAAEALFERAVSVGWDRVHGGLAYTVGPDGSAGNDDHYWWPVAEGIGAAAWLQRTTGRDSYEEWYRQLWDYAAAVLIDPRRGGWYPQFDARNRRRTVTWSGKPDLYHALQATLLPVLPLAPGVAGAIRRSLVAGGVDGTDP